MYVWKGSFFWLPHKYRMRCIIREKNLDKWLKWGKFLPFMETTHHQKPHVKRTEERISEVVLSYNFKLEENSSFSSCTEEVRGKD